MTRKRTGNDPRRPKSRGRASKSRRPNKGNASERSQTRRSRLLQVASDMRRDNTLAFTQACHNRGVNPQSRHRHVTALFYKDASGKVRPRKTDSYAQEISIPSTRPGVSIHFVARGSKERQLVGEWFAALKEAGGGDFTRLSTFPKGTFVDGVRLPTGAYEVQCILEAMEDSESPLEELYSIRGAV